MAFGPNFPVSTAADYVNTGFNSMLGIEFWPSESRRIGFRLMGEGNFGHGFEEEKWQEIASVLLDGNMRTWSITGNAIVPFSRGKVGFYVTGGAGVYWRTIEITRPGVSEMVICDPWYGWCYPTLVSVEVIVGSNTLTEFGWNAGAGISFAVGGGSIFLEGLYHSFQTDPQYSDPEDTPSTTYVPVRLGFRF